METTTQETGAQGATSQETKAPKASWKEVDPALFSQGYFAEKVEIDENANAYASARPIQPDKYLGFVELDKPSFETIHYDARKTDKGDELPAADKLRANVVFTAAAFANGSDVSVMKGKLKTAPAEVYFSARQGSEGVASQAVSFLNFVGVQAGSGNKVADLADALKQKLTGTEKAVIGANLGWRVWDPKAPAGNGRTGAWIKSFSRNADGTLNPIVTVNGEERTAQLYVINFFNPAAAAQPQK